MVGTQERTVRWSRGTTAGCTLYRDVKYLPVVSFAYHSGINSAILEAVTSDSGHVLVEIEDTSVSLA